MMDILCPKCKKELIINEGDNYAGADHIFYSCKCTLDKQGEKFTTIGVEVSKRNDEIERIEIFKDLDEGWMSFLCEYYEGICSWNIAIEDFYEDDSEILVEGYDNMSVDDAWKLLNRYYSLKCFL